jgi:hypothetical protein
MKSPCPTSPSLNPNGLSNTIKQNGFSVLLAGRASGGITAEFGGGGFFWSSSSFNFNFEAYYRFLFYSPTPPVPFSPQVLRSTNLRSSLYSVRCKKD